jgi:hypothetical protein
MLYSALEGQSEVQDMHHATDEVAIINNAR